MDVDAPRTYLLYNLQSSNCQRLRSYDHMVLYKLDYFFINGAVLRSYYSRQASLSNIRNDLPAGDLSTPPLSQSSENISSHFSAAVHIHASLFIVNGRQEPQLLL